MPLEDRHQLIIYRHRWLTETWANFTYPLGITLALSNTSPRFGNRAQPVNTSSTCALQSWRLNHSLLVSASTYTHGFETSSLYCKATTLTFRHTSSKPTPHLMLRQMPHHQQPLPQLFQARGQSRKLKKGPNGKRSSTLRALSPILGRGTTRRQQTSS